MSIELKNTETGARALITTLFVSKMQKNPKFAYVLAFGQSLKCVAAVRMSPIKIINTLPSTLFGKRKGPFMKLEPVAPWVIVGNVD